MVLNEYAAPVGAVREPPRMQQLTMTVGAVREPPLLRKEIDMSFNFDVEAVRREFPACSRTKNGKPVAYLDGPGGTQVPRRVAKKIEEYLFNHNANEHGAFDTSGETDRLFQEARGLCAEFMNALPTEIAFGHSSTKNNFELSFAIGRELSAGDEILITDIDHLCNRAPWLSLQERGVVVKSAKVDRDKQQVDMDDFRNKLSKRTKVVAVNWASNALGTVSDVKEMCALAHEFGAITVVDAVHYAPHFPVDVKEIDTDVLLCSAYKFFGPHLGVIYMKEALTDRLKFYNVGADDLTHGISKFQFGTPPFETICGVGEAIRYIESIGNEYLPYFEKETEGLNGVRRGVVAGLMAIDHHEAPLARLMRDEFRRMPGVTVYGPAEGEPRSPTVIITVDGKHPADVCRTLNDNGVNAWDGDFYATVVVNEVLGLKDKGGLIRFGLAPYNTKEEIERAISVIGNL